MKPTTPVLSIPALIRPLRATGIVLRRHGVVVSVCIAAVLLPVLTFAYSSAAPSSYSATVRVAVYEAGHDPLVRSTTLRGSRLQPYLAAVTSLQVARAAVRRMPDGPLPSSQSFIKTANELRREISVRLGPQGSTLEITARAPSQARAATIANAFVGGLQQLRAAEAQRLARQAVAAGLEVAARLPRDSKARRAAIAAYVSRLVLVLPDREVQIVQPAKSGSPRSLALLGIAAAIALLVVLALLLLTGTWRPRPSQALP